MDVLIFSVFFFLSLCYCVPCLLCYNYFKIFFMIRYVVFSIFNFGFKIYVPDFRSRSTCRVHWKTESYLFCHHGVDTAANKQLFLIVIKCNSHRRPKGHGIWHFITFDFKWIFQILTNGPSFIYPTVPLSLPFKTSGSRKLAEHLLFKGNIF